MRMFPRILSEAFSAFVAASLGCGRRRNSYAWRDENETESKKSAHANCIKPNAGVVHATARSLSALLQAVAKAFRAVGLLIPLG